MAAICAEEVRLKKMIALESRQALHTKRTDEYATKHVFGYSKLFFIAVTNLCLSFLGFRLICFSLVGLNFLSNRFILVNMARKGFNAA